MVLFADSLGIYRRFKNAGFKGSAFTGSSWNGYSSKITVQKINYLDQISLDILPRILYQASLDVHCHEIFICC